MTEMQPKPTGESSGIPRRRNHREGEDGYILLAVLFMVAMVLILLAVAAPKVAADIERDREVELQHRGKQYVRAIKLYYKKFGAYPPNMDALEKTSEIRFLRKRYKDPVTGKDEWHLIHFGENKTPTAYGFFGQPMGGSSVAGIGPGGVGQSAGGSIFGNNGTNGGSAFGSSGSAFGSSGSAFGNSGGSAFGSSGSAFGNSGTGIGGGLSNSNSGFSNNTSGTTGGSSDPTAANANSGSTTSGSTGTSSTGTSTDPNAAGGSSSTSSTGNAGGSIFASSNGTGNGQTFGGGGIIGVESTSPKVTILEYKKKKHFNEWEFVYDPMQDQMMLSNNTGAVGQPMSGAGNSSSGIATPGAFGGQAPVNGSIPPQQQQQPQQQQPQQQQQQ